MNNTINKCWYYYGNGMADFGRYDRPQEAVMPIPGPDEMLVRVDAVAVCASDIKMITMGNAYPLFKDRDFHSEPAILGHELSLCVEAVGEHLQSTFQKGMRLGIQPDVYMKGIRYCIGVNVQGGMQKYMLLDTSVFQSDHGITVFALDDTCSYASIAQLEPNACVEAAYRPFARSHMDSTKSLLVYIADDVKKEYHIDMDITHKTMIACGPATLVQHYVPGAIHVASLNDVAARIPEGVADVLILGNPPADILAKMVALLATDSIFCWLIEQETSMQVACDIAKIHYSRINFLGSATQRLSDAFAGKRQRYDLCPQGSMLIMGGAGAMGRMHTLRAIMHPAGPTQIVVSARSHDRLAKLLEDFKDLAQQQHKQLYGIATNDATWMAQLHAIAPMGYDDVIVSAPGIEPVEQALPFIKQEGMLVLFSGTRYDSFTALPLGNVASYGCRVNASSGSSVDDEKAVLQKLYEGQLNPDRNVVGIAGFDAIKDALIAVSQGVFAGKVILYPQLDTLPLTTMQDIRHMTGELADYVREHGWNREAERLLYKAYYKEGVYSYEE